VRYLPPGVRGTRDDVRGEGYLVPGPDGADEWYRLAWQATARAHGWTPPAPVEAPVPPLLAGLAAPPGAAARCVAVFDDVRCQKGTGHAGAHVGCNGEVWLTPRPRWARVLRAPRLYLAHRRLGLARAAAARLVWSVVTYRGCDA
jgi:hypothetical protein